MKVSQIITTAAALITANMLTMVSSQQIRGGATISSSITGPTQTTEHTTASTQLSAAFDETSAALVNSNDHRELAELPDFCWRTSYGRGVGSIPDSCPLGREKIGLLCYSKCPAGYARVGVDCHQICPSDMQDQGLFCRLPEYGRGAGYPWQFNDGFSNSGMIGRCERDYGSGKCEMWGAVAYPKCKVGYSPAGCCICRPNPPNCAARGLSVQLDLSCFKKIIVGDPISMGCPASKQMDAGLCYSPCNKGFSGVGPVCWGDAPAGMVQCGMGAAKDSLTCADVTTNQIMAVGELAMFIGTMGASSTGKIATNSVKYTELAAKYKKLVEAYKSVKKQYSTVITAVETSQTIVSASGQIVSVAQMESLSDPVDMIRMAAEIASLLDPTGISSIVAAYSYPMCNTII